MEEKYIHALEWREQVVDVIVSHEVLDRLLKCNIWTPILFPHFIIGGGVSNFVTLTCCALCSKQKFLLEEKDLFL